MCGCCAAQALLQEDPAARPTAQEALRHPWLQLESRTEDPPLGDSIVQRLQRFHTYDKFKQVSAWGSGRSQ